MNIVENLKSLIRKAKIERNLTLLEEIEETISNLISTFSDFRKNNRGKENQDLKHEIDQLYDLDALIIKIFAYITTPAKPIKTPIVYNPTYLKLRLKGENK